MKEKKRDGPLPCPLGDLMQMMSVKKISFTFLFSFPDQEICTGCFTHPLNFSGINWGYLDFFILNGYNICTLQLTNSAKGLDRKRDVLGGVTDGCCR
jgi:hypothetical protein